MIMRGNLLVLGAIATLVGGCAYLGIPTRTESPTSIGHLSAPSQVVRGQPVTLEVWAFVGVDGSYSPGDIKASVNDAERTVSIKATSIKTSSFGAAYTMSVTGFRQRSVSFTPGLAGTYRVSAQQPDSSDFDDYQPFVPRAFRSTTIEIKVVEP